jgi:hypothetical protein
LIIFASFDFRRHYAMIRHAAASHYADSAIFFHITPALLPALAIYAADAACRQRRLPLSFQAAIFRRRLASTYLFSTFSSPHYAIAAAIADADMPLRYFDIRRHAFDFRFDFISLLSHFVSFSHILR